MSRQQIRSWLISLYQNAPHAARFKILEETVIPDDGDDDDDDYIHPRPAPPSRRHHHSSISASVARTRAAYESLEAVRVLCSPKAGHIRDQMQLDLYSSLISKQLELKTIERFAKGTTFANALTTLRLECELKEPKTEDPIVSLFNKASAQKLEVWELDRVPSHKKEPEMKVSNTAASLASKQQPPQHQDQKKNTHNTKKNTAIMPQFKFRPVDTNHFGGPFWNEIPALQLHLATLDVYGEGMKDAMWELYGGYYDYACLHSIHPAIRIAAKVVLRACVMNYCTNLPLLKAAILAWRRNYAMGSRDKEIDGAECNTLRCMEANCEFWRVINKACFVDGSSTSELMQCGVLPDIVERMVIPSLIAVKVLELKTGACKFAVTREKTGIAGFKRFTAVDLNAKAASLASPSWICSVVLNDSSAPPMLRRSAVELAGLVSLTSWTSATASSIHEQSDPARRNYPYGSGSNNNDENGAHQAAGAGTGSRRVG